MTTEFDFFDKTFRAIVKIVTLKFIMRLLG